MTTRVALDGVLLLMPLLAPAPGGAAQYAVLLSTGLVEAGIAERVEVLSEHYPGTAAREERAGGRVVYRRIFPFRAGRSHRDWWSYVGYLIQNIQFLRLPYWVGKSGARALLVHSSFHLRPSTISIAIRLVRLLYGDKIRIVADIRDPKLKPSQLSRLRDYDVLLCCGERLLRDLEGSTPALAERASLVPIPFVPRVPSVAEVDSTLARHGLKRDGFFFFPNGLSVEKGIELAIAAVAGLGPARKDRPLVVAGRSRDMTPAIRAAVASGLVQPLGILPNAEILALDAAASAVLNVSAKEGLPRSALEAFAVGARILLPPGIPEFERHCRDYTFPAYDPSIISAKLGEILDLPPPSYPLEDHYPERVMKCYRDLLIGR
jgi:glycosyltransferase involved in cell wall biosynthesis